MESANEEYGYGRRRRHRDTESPGRTIVL